MRNGPFDPAGQGLAEHAILLVLIAVVVIIILALLGPAINNVFEEIVDTIDGLPCVGGPPCGNPPCGNPPSSQLVTQPGEIPDLWALREFPP